MKVYSSVGITADFIQNDRPKMIEHFKTRVSVLQRYFEGSELSKCCELKFVSAAHNPHRHSAAIIFDVVPYDQRAFNVLKLKWSDFDFETFFNYICMDIISDSIEADHFGNIIEIYDGTTNVSDSQ